MRATNTRIVDGGSGMAASPHRGELLLETGPDGHVEERMRP
jgi:hypothetical protein